MTPGEAVMPRVYRARAARARSRARRSRLQGTEDNHELGLGAQPVARGREGRYRAGDVQQAVQVVERFPPGAAPGGVPRAPVILGEDELNFARRAVPGGRDRLDRRLGWHVRLELVVH